MTDKFKEYLSENKDWFSPEEPGERVWEYISRRTVKGSVIFLYIKRIAAACIILLGGVSIYLVAVKSGKHDKNRNLITDAIDKADTIQKFPASLTKNQYEPVSNKKRNSSTSNQLASTTKKTEHQKKKLDPTSPQKFVYISGEELALKYESTFTKLIEHEKTIISTTPVYGVSADYFELIVKDYQLLESEEETIKEKIKTSGGSLDALDQLITNFQRRIDLLKKLWTEIDRKNSQATGRKNVNIIYVRII